MQYIKQYESKMNGMINPQNYNFKTVILMFLKQNR